MTQNNHQMIVTLESIGDDSSMNIQEGRAMLSAEEIKQADAYHFPTHRDRYIRGRALLRKKLAEMLSCVPAEITIEKGTYGKPFVRNSGIAFNLSHSEDLAVYAFSDSMDAIGVDIELLDRRVSVDGISEKFFTPGERAELRKVSEMEKSKMFFKIWTAKEARMKLHGDGLNLEPIKIDLVFKEGTPIGFHKPETCDVYLTVREIQRFNAMLSILGTSEFDLTGANFH